MPDYQFIVDFITTFDRKGAQEFADGLSKAHKNIQKIQSIVSRTEEFATLDRNLREAGIGSLAVDGTMRRLDGTFMSTQESIVAYSKAMEKTHKTSRRFKYEWLGIMFLGQRIARVFESVLRPAQEIFGISEIWSMTMADLMAPAMEGVAELAMDLSDGIMSMDEDAKGFASTLVLLGYGLGQALDFVGTAALGIASLALIFGTSAGAMALSLGVILAAVVAAAAAIYVLWELWKMYQKWIDETANQREEAAQKQEEFLDKYAEIFGLQPFPAIEKVTPYGVPTTGITMPKPGEAGYVPPGLTWEEIKGGIGIVPPVGETNITINNTIETTTLPEDITAWVNEVSERFVADLRKELGMG